MGRGDGSRTPWAGLWACVCHGPSPQLTKEEETFAFTAMQDFPVRNLQPATVTLYDYYETGEPRRGHAPGCPGPLPPPVAPDSEGAKLSCRFTLTSFGSSPGGAHPEPTGHHHPVAGDRTDAAYSAPCSSGRARGHPTLGSLMGTPRPPRANLGCAKPLAPGEGGQRVGVVEPSQEHGWIDGSGVPQALRH